MADFTKLNGYTVKDPNAVHTYDTVADLKADTKLKAGNHVQTKGYTTAGDGGHASYIIVDDNTLVDDGGSIHALTNGLFAVLLNNEYVTPEMYGAYGDGVHDDSTAIQKAINSGKVVEFAPKTYICYSLTVDRPTVLHGNGATLKRPELDIAPYNLTVAEMKWIRTADITENCIITNMVFDNNCFTMWQPSDGYAQEQSCSLLVRNTAKVIELVIDKCEFKNSAGDGLHIVDNVNANITNCRSIDCFRGGLTSTGYGSEINVDNWISEVHTAGVNDGFDVEVDSASSVYPEKYILNMNNVTLDYDLDIMVPKKGVANLNNITMRSFDETNIGGFVLGARAGGVLNISNSKLRSGKTPSVQIYIQEGNVNFVNCAINGNATDPVLRVSQYQPGSLTYDGELNIHGCKINGHNFMSVANIRGYINVDSCEIKCNGDFIVNNGNSSPAVQHLYLQNNKIKFSGMFITLTKSGAIDSTVNLYLYGNTIKGGGDDYIKTWADANIYYDSTPMEGALRLQKGGGSIPPVFLGQDRVIIVNTASELTFAGWVAGNDIAIAKDTGIRYQYASGTTWNEITS